MPNGSTQDSNYRIIKQNVDNLKLIQIGITLANEFGEMPEDLTTWQFNLKFDLERDTYLTESINLLELAGIDFKSFFQKGIDVDYFGEFITTSGLVLNEDVKWITFHGSYDFAYLIKALSNQVLPEEEIAFNDLLTIYFPTFYDVRHMIKNMSWLKGSLSRICGDLDIKRVGSTHQAGSDSLITSKLFFKLVNSYSEQIDIFGDKNKLYGFSYKMSDDYDGYNPYQGYNNFNQMPFIHPMNVNNINSHSMNNLMNQSSKLLNNKNGSTNQNLLYFQNLNNGYNTGNLNVSPLFYNNNNISGYGHIYPQQMDYNYYASFYNGNNGNNGMNINPVGHSHGNSFNNPNFKGTIGGNGK